MSHPYHHAVSSSRKWGGVPEDYQPIHDWFDETKKLLPDFRHRALRHHSEGIFMCEAIFGTTISLSTCAKCGVLKSEHWTTNGDDHAFTAKQIPVRWIGEQHVQEDIGLIPTAADWLQRIQAEPWMYRSRKLSRELEATDSQRLRKEGEEADAKFLRKFGPDTGN